jgi:hypothetical protein
MSGSGGYYKYRCKYWLTYNCPNWVWVNNAPCAHCLVCPVFLRSPFGLLTPIGGRSRLTSGGRWLVGRYWRGEAGAEGCSHRSGWSEVFGLELVGRNNSIIIPIIHSGKGRAEAGVGIFSVEAQSTRPLSLAKQIT